MCTDCGKDRPNHCAGKCNTCYKRAKFSAPKYDCTACGDRLKIKPQNVAGLCTVCRRKEYQRSYFQANKADLVAKNIEWKSRNRESPRETLRKHYIANKSQYRAKDALRRANELRATPAWADKEAIKAIYAACPKGYHVDHIVPLKGKNVCGLHVAENLQILPAAENIRKNNKF